jgi:CheY-like chemotaxis protein
MRICIIDDNAIVSDALSMLLRDGGHDVVTAVSAEEGAALVEQSEPDFVVIDLDLPGTSGAVLAATLRARHRALPLVLTSGHQAPSPGSVGASGADLFLAKPFTPSTLGAAFASIVAQREAAA